MLKTTKFSVPLLGLCLLASLTLAQDPKPKAKGVNDALPRPNGKPADVSKTVKVFILMGQSNMLEMGTAAVLNDTRQVCISDGKASRQGLEP